MTTTTKETLKYTLWLDGRTFRAEPDNFNGRAIAREQLQARIGVPCFGNMKRPDFLGSFSVTGASEEEALAKARDVEADCRSRIAAGVEQLVMCATCPFSEPCFRLTMAAKNYTN